MLWGEARLLLEAVVSVTSTVLGAKLAGWAYPASMPELLQLASGLSEKASKRVMPWAMDVPGRSSASAEERAAAEAELEAGFVIG